MIMNRIGVLVRGCAVGAWMAGLTCLAGRGWADDPAAASAAMPSLDAIIGLNAAARGGLEGWRHVVTLTERGRIEHGQLKAPKARHGAVGPGPRSVDQSLPFMLQFKRPHKMRLEMDLGDAKALQLFDGASGWTLQPSAQGPLVHAYSPGEATAAADQADPEGPLLDAPAKGTRIAFEGTDVVEGRTTYKLKLTLKNGAERNVWIDAQTYLDVKIDGTQVIEGRVWPTATYFYDWREAKVAGATLRVPGRIETAIGEYRTTSRIIVEQIIVDRPIDDEVFSLPARTASAR